MLFRIASQLLVPERRLESRISDGWKEVGFQGDDPATDFRGMGLLGLENLLFFARTYPAAAAHVLSHSRHPHYGYSFACVGINLTHMSHRMWTDGAAKSHVYNACHQSQAEVHPFFAFRSLSDVPSLEAKPCVTTVSAANILISFHYSTWGRPRTLSSLSKINEPSLY